MREKSLTATQFDDLDKTVTVFLNALDKRLDASFNIEHYTDLPKGSNKPKPDGLGGRYANLTRREVGELLPQLQEKNEAGAGIFIARNQCEGHRSEKAISRVRGVHADMDGVSAEELADLTGLLQPSIVVESSPGRYQLYWQLTEGEYLEPAEAKAINQCLASQHGADPAAVDVSRLLRLPGFKHMKYRQEGRTPVVIATYSDITYTSAQLRTAFPIEDRGKSLPKKSESQPTAREQFPATLRDAAYESIVARVRSEHPLLWQGRWEARGARGVFDAYTSQSSADLALAGYIARACVDAGLHGESLRLATEAIFSKSGLAHRDKWVDRSDYRDNTISKALQGLRSSGSGPADAQLFASEGDIRNAKAFARMAHGQLVNVTTRGQWLRWEGENWLLCEKDEQIGFAKKVCNQLLLSAGAFYSQNQDRGRKLIADAMAAHNLPKIQAMIRLAVSEPNMAVTERELDRDPYLVGLQNGVFDVRTGQLSKNTPEHLITRYCSAAYQGHEQCPRWLRFLSQVFPDDPETIESVQRLLGYTLTGLSTEEILVICYGHGSNGKSVFSNVVQEILGGYAITAPPSLLTARKGGDTSPRNDLAALAGARYVSINETQAGDRLDEQVVKMLAGREPISARFLHREYFEFHPTFTPWLRTNHKPIIMGEDDGIWRRLVLIPFAQQFTGENKDPNLQNALLNERDGILAWMLRGAVMYCKDGLQLSNKILKESLSYREESDLLGEFLKENTILDPLDRVIQRWLYRCYSSWCDINGLRRLSKKSFTQRLAERGYPEGKSGGERFYAGLRLGEFVAAAQGVLDGMSGHFDNSLYEDSNKPKYPNTQQSSPSCPSDAPTVGGEHVK